MLTFYSLEHLHAQLFYKYVAGNVCLDLDGGSFILSGNEKLLSCSLLIPLSGVFSPAADADSHARAPGT